MPPSDESTRTPLQSTFPVGGNRNTTIPTWLSQTAIFPLPSTFPFGGNGNLITAVSPAFVSSNLQSTFPVGGNGNIPTFVVSDFHFFLQSTFPVGGNGNIDTPQSLRENKSLPSTFPVGGNRNIDTQPQLGWRHKLAKHFPGRREWKPIVLITQILCRNSCQALSRSEGMETENNRIGESYIRLGACQALSRSEGMETCSFQSPLVVQFSCQALSRSEGMETRPSQFFLGK